MDLSNNDSVEILTRIIGDYNDNINYYNSNMRHLINSITRIIDAQPTYNNQPFINTRNSRTNLFEQTPQQRFSQQYTRPGWNYQLFNYIPYLTQNLQDVVVRPTQLQIDNACEYYTHDNTMPENTCPISLIAFQEGDEICRIRHCGHTFIKNSIITWFHPTH